MPNTDFPYLHGFAQIEQDRLVRQARFMEHVIYRDVNFSECSEVLEVGCGVGAQSEILLRRFPDLKLTGIDRSEGQLEGAKKRLGVHAELAGRYSFLQGDATKLPFKGNTYDGAFLCWILEHVPNPQKVLSEVRRVLRPGSPIYITEVLNSSFFLEPYSPNVWKYWMAFNDFQYDQKGDPFVGAKLGNLLLQMGLTDIRVRPKTLHLDNRRPDKRKEYIDFWTDLLLSASEQLVKAGAVEQEVVDKMQEELEHVASDPNAVFYYTFIQAKSKVL